MSKLTADEIEAHLTPELQQFIESELASGRYKSAGEMLCQGVALLKDREEDFQRLRDEVRSRLAQLDRGEGIVLNDEEALHGFFEDVNARGLERYESRKQGG